MIMNENRIYPQTDADSANETSQSRMANEQSRESSVIPHIIKAMEHDISDAFSLDPVVAYKAIEKGVVGAYKAVEKGAVEAYHKVENTMVDKLFRRESETIEQAKNRLRRK